MGNVQLWQVGVLTTKGLLGLCVCMGNVQL